MYRKNLFLAKRDVEEVMTQFVSLCKNQYNIRRKHVKGIIDQFQKRDGKAERKLTHCSFAFFKLIEIKYGLCHVYTLNPFQIETDNKKTYRHRKGSKFPRAVVYFELIKNDTCLRPDAHISCLHRKKFLQYLKNRVHVFWKFSGIPKDVVKIIFSLVDTMNRNMDILLDAEIKISLYERLIMEAFNQNKIVFEC